MEGLDIQRNQRWECPPTPPPPKKKNLHPQKWTLLRKKSLDVCSMAISYIFFEGERVVWPVLFSILAVTLWARDWLWDVKNVPLLDFCPEMQANEIQCSLWISITKCHFHITSYLTELCVFWWLCRKVDTVMLIVKSMHLINLHFWTYRMCTTEHFLSVKVLFTSKEVDRSSSGMHN